MRFPHGHAPASLFPDDHPLLWFSDRDAWCLRDAYEGTQIFGGTKIIVPAHWEVKSDMTAIFGGIDDKRAPSPTVDHSKVLVLDGTSIFGGIELVSY